MSEETYWLTLWLAVIAGVVAITFTMTDYADRANGKILQATTCMQIVTINGDSYERGVALCALLEAQKNGD